MTGLPSSRALPLKPSKKADCFAQIKTIMVQPWIRIFSSKSIKSLFKFSCSSELNSNPNKLLYWLCSFSAFDSRTKKVSQALSLFTIKLFSLLIKWGDTAGEKYKPFPKFSAVISTEKGCIVCYLYIFLWPR